MEGSCKEYAAHRREAGDRGCSRQAVEKAILSGRLPPAVVSDRRPRRILDFAAADKAWEANTRPSLSGPPVAALPPPRDPGSRSDAAGADDGPRDYSTERARREYYAAEKLRQQVEERDGRSMPTEAATSIVASAGAMLQRKLLDVSDRLCEKVAAEARAAASQQEAEAIVHTLLDDEYRTILEEMSNAACPGD